MIAPDEGRAIQAVGIKRGSTHPLDSTLVAAQPEANANGFGVWIVSVKWSLLGRGNKDPSGKPRISWRRSVSSEAFDRDPDGNPITNSAGDVFDPPPEDEVADRGFIIRRVEPFYDLDKAEEYENTVNDKGFTFLGRYTFKQGQVLCESIMPATDYDFDATSIEIEYAFWFRRDGWKRRIVDEGRRAFYYDDTDKTNKKAEIYGADGTQVSTPVLLDGGGSPLDDTLKIGKGKVDAVSAANPPAGAEVDRDSATMVFLKWKRKRETSFGGLEL